MLQCNGLDLDVCSLSPWSQNTDTDNEGRKMPSPRVSGLPAISGKLKNSCFLTCSISFPPGSCRVQLLWGTVLVILGD